MFFKFKVLTINLEISQKENLNMKKLLRFVLIVLAYKLLISDANANMFWNQACVISTNSSYISIPNSPTLNITGSITLETWIYPFSSTMPTSQILIDKHSSTLAGYSLSLENGRVSIRTNSGTQFTGNNVIGNNSWTHVAGVYNTVTDRFSIYINGTLDTMSGIIPNAEPNNNGDSLKIGRSFFGNTFIGCMDEVRVWRSANSEALINLYRRSSLGAGTGIYNTLSLSLTFQSNESVGLDFSLNDWSGNQNNGTNNGVDAFDLSNRPSVTISPNESLVFDGASDYVSAPSNSSVQPTTGITLESWIYPYDVTNELIIHKGSANGATTNYRLRISNGILSAIINENSSFSSGDSIKPNRWTHVAFTYEGSTGEFKFYIDGKKSGEGVNKQENIDVSSERIYFGGTSSLASFFGFIDEVRISNYVKSRRLINQYLYESIDDQNKPNMTSVNVVYNLDGYSNANADGGPVLEFFGDARFSHCGVIENCPVSPTNRIDSLYFQKGFYIHQSDKRIPPSGSAGTTYDTLEMFVDTAIADINVFIAINHTHEQDMIIDLIGPNGAVVNLFNRDSLVNRSDNVITVFDDQAGSALTNGLYVSFSPLIRPISSITSAYSGTKTNGKWILRISDVGDSGVGRLYAWGLQFNNMHEIIPSIRLSFLIQGYYLGGGYGLSDNSPVDESCMVKDEEKGERKCKDDPKTDKCKCDEIEVGDPLHGPVAQTYGHDSDCPPTDFTINLPILNTPSASMLDSSFYLYVKQKNSIRTWSSVKLEFDPLDYTLEYDFLFSDSSAWGQNEWRFPFPRKEPVCGYQPFKDLFALFSGEVTDDGVINNLDQIAVDNSIINYAHDVYSLRDVTGDFVVDGTDAAIVENNLGVGEVEPPPF